MTYQKKETEQRERYTPLQYSDRDLADMDKKIRVFTNDDGHVNIQAFLKSVGAISENGSIIVAKYQPSEGSGADYHTWKCERPTKYEFWQNVIRQWHDWNCRIEWAKKNEMKALETLSNQN